MVLVACAKVSGVCLGYDPIWNPSGGHAAGDDLCANGYKGPLCAVCEPNHYKNNNLCT